MGGIKVEVEAKCPLQTRLEMELVMELPGVHYISGFAQPRYVWRGDVTVSFAPNSMAWEGSASSLMENRRWRRRQSGSIAFQLLLRSHRIAIDLAPPVKMNMMEEQTWTIRTLGIQDESYVSPFSEELWSVPLPEFF